LGSKKAGGYDQNGRGFFNGKHVEGKGRVKKMNRHRLTYTSAKPEWRAEEKLDEKKGIVRQGNPFRWKEKEKRLLRIILKRGKIGRVAVLGEPRKKRKNDSKFSNATSKD